jgi:hypothetical protein
MNMGDALYLLITDEAMRRWHPAVGSRAGALICCGKTVKRAVIHVMHEMRERANAHQPFVNCHLRSDAEPDYTAHCGYYIGKRVQLFFSVNSVPTAKELALLLISPETVYLSAFPHSLCHFHTLPLLS